MALAVEECFFSLLIHNYLAKYSEVPNLFQYISMHLFFKINILINMAKIVKTFKVSKSSLSLLPPIIIQGRFLLLPNSYDQMCILKFKA